MKGFDLQYASEALRKCARQLGVRKGSWQPVQPAEDGRPDYEDVRAIVYDKNGNRRGEVTKLDLVATGK